MGGRRERIREQRMTPGMRNFRAGEINPKLDARPDLKMYHSACLNLVNAMPIVEGGITRIPGTKYVKAVRQEEDGWRLTVVKTGSGSGTVVGTVGGNPLGINCGTVCVYYYANGTNVTLTATADTYSRFKGWSGHGFSGTAPITVTMDGDKVIGAKFVRRSRLLYQYPIPHTADCWLRILDLNYDVDSDTSIGSTSTLSNLNGAIRWGEAKERALVDDNRNIFMCVDSISGVYQLRIYRMNLDTLTYTTLAVSVPDNLLAFTDGEAVWDVINKCYKIFLCRWSSMAGNKVYVVDMNTFTLDSEFGGGGTIYCTGGGIHVRPESDRIYVLSDSPSSPLYVEVHAWKHSDHSYVGKASSVASGTLGSPMKTGMFEYEDRLFFLTKTSTTAGGGAGKIVRVNLPNITDAAGIVMPGTGRGLCLCRHPSIPSIAYVLTETHLVMMDIGGLTMETMSSIDRAAAQQSMTIDDENEAIYVTVYGNPSKLYVYDMYSLAELAVYTRLYAGSIFLVEDWAQ